MLRFLTFLGLCGIGLAQEPPRFVIDPGTHSRPINATSVDSKETFLVTGSSDKTVRLWDLHDGKLIKTIHLPVSGAAGQAKEGEVYAVAISPDDTTIAYGGRTGFAFRNNRGSFFTYNRQNDTIAEHPGFESDIKTLFFNADGKYLVYSTSGRTTGVADRDADYKTSAPFQVTGGIAADVAHLPQGDVVVMLWRQPKSPEGSPVKVRVYQILSTGLKLLKETACPYPGADSLRLTPNGQYMIISAQGDEDQPRLFDAWATFQDKHFDLKVPGDPIGIATPLPDSSGFSAPLVLENDAETPAIVTWKFGPGGVTSTIQKLKTLEDAPEDGLITPLKNGRVIWSSSWGDWDLIDNDKYGASSRFDCVDLDEHDNVGVSNDGLEVFFRDTNPDTDPLRKAGRVLSLTQRSLVPSIALAKPYRYFDGGDAKVPGLDLEGHRLNGRPLPVPSDENIGPTEFTSGAIYLGGESEVYAIRKDATLLWKTKGLGSGVVQLRATPNGKVIFAVLKDGTFRWLSADQGDLRLSAFVSGDRRRWIAWTPEGYYDAGPGGESLGGWVVNRTDGSLRGDYFGLAQFSKDYYRPELVQAALSGKAPAPVVQTTLTRGGSLPPVVSIRKAHSLSVTSTSLDFTYTVQSDQPVTRVSVRIDGANGNTPRGVRPAGTSVHVDIPASDCEVTLIVENAAGPGTDTLHVHWDGPVAAVRQKPALWVLSIGISRYPQPGWALGLPAKDAEDIAAAFGEQKQAGFYSAVNTKLLTNEEATKDGIEDALDHFFDKTQPGDFAVVFLAGHGVADARKNYYFLPVGFVPGHYLTSAVSFDDITKLTSAIKARTVLFIDTCRSGGLNEARLSAIADINAIANGMSDASNGLVVFTASTGQQTASERTDWGNGAFTKAIIEGLSGVAVDRKGEIRISSLDGYVSRRVADLTCNMQTPVCAKRVPDFSIGKAAALDEPPAAVCKN